MPDLSAHQVKTGSDPRALPDFIALNNEMSKLMHPARPDIDWMRAEVLALSLFERNGVELQTVAWYTLARAHLARVSGMNEGLNILSALLGHQWAQCWPLQTQARAEILNGLMQRLQKVFRTFTLTFGDHTPLVRSEKLLMSLNDTLARQQLVHVCMVSALLQQVRNAIIRLESPPSDDNVAPAKPRSVPVKEMLNTADKQGSERLVWLVNPETDVAVTSQPTIRARRWPIFLAGMLFAVLVYSAAGVGWHYIHRPEPAVQALTATLSPFPVPLTTQQLDRLRESEALEKRSTLWLARTAAHLDYLATLSPVWNLRYGGQLLEQSEALWPGSPQVAQMKAKWEQQLTINTLSPDALSGWYCETSRTQS